MPAEGQGARLSESSEMTERERGDRLEAMIERLAERNVAAGLEISSQVLDAVRNESRLVTIEDFREWARRKGGTTRVMMDRAIQEITSWALRSDAVSDRDALAAENERLRAALEDMVDLDPYGVDSADYWCIYCCVHGDKPEAIKHDPLCTWVRAEAVLSRRVDGGA